MKHNLNKEPKGKKKRKVSSTGFRGVTKKGERYQAMIGIGNGKKEYLDTFDTDKEAARVYDRTVLKHVNAKKKVQKVQKKKVQKVKKKKEKEKRKKMDKKEMKTTKKKKTRVQGLMELVGHTHFHDEMFNRQ